MTYRDTAMLCHARVRSWASARRFVTAATIALAACLSLAPAAAARGRAHQRGCAGAHTPIAASSRASLKRAVLCLINGRRHAHGLPALRANPRLSRSAQGWTNEMVLRRDLTHGADFASRITAVGFDWSNAGENIATGFETPAAVVRAWMASTGHCQNILNPTFRFVGTGVDAGSAGAGVPPGTWTQDFGLLMGESPASGNWGPAGGCPYR